MSEHKEIPSSTENMDNPSEIDPATTHISDALPTATSTSMMEPDLTSKDIASHTSPENDPTDTSTENVPKITNSEENTVTVTSPTTTPTTTTMPLDTGLLDTDVNQSFVRTSTKGADEDEIEVEEDNEEIEIDVAHREPASTVHLARETDDNLDRSVPGASGHYPESELAEEHVHTPMGVEEDERIEEEGWAGELDVEMYGLLGEIYRWTREEVSGILLFEPLLPVIASVGTSLTLRMDTVARRQVDRCDRTHMTILIDSIRRHGMDKFRGIRCRTIVVDDSEGDSSSDEGRDIEEGHGRGKRRAGPKAIYTCKSR